MAKKPKLLPTFSMTRSRMSISPRRRSRHAAEDGKSRTIERTQAAFLKHQKETVGQIKRLEGVFKIFGKKPTAKKCEAIMGITKEGAEIMTEYKGMPALDAGLAAAAQAVEHYEISRYGTLATLGEGAGDA